MKKISDYIEFLEELIDKYGDIEIDIDFEAHEEALRTDTKMQIIFNEGE